MILLKFFIVGIFTALLFPPFFMTPLGFIIFPYIINLLKENSTKRKINNYFFIGFFYGLGFLLVLLFWIQSPFFTNNETKNFAILSLLLPIFLSLFFGIGFIFFKYIKNTFHLIFFTPFIFLFIELAISKTFYGFPWVTYSLVLSNNILGFYFLKSFGTFVSSYLVLMIFLAPSLIIFSLKSKYEKIKIFIFHLPFLICLFFIFIFNENYKGQGKIISFEVFQILSPIQNPNKKLIEQDIINKINQSNAEYLVFAENNYPYLISDISNLSILNYIKDNQKVIIGASRLNNNKLYNSFLYLEKNNTQIFDKEILVPFGEFLPFRNYLKFMENISGNIDFTSGQNNRLISNRDINILPIICYEIIFNKILKDINKNNIDILINITNDSWFGDKMGPYQHFYHSRMRAIISNKFLIRVSNNGISAIIDNNGKILQSSKLNVKTNLYNKLHLKSFTYQKFIHKISEIYLLIIFFTYSIFLKYRSRYEK